MGRNADGSWSVVSIPGDTFRGGGDRYSPERQLAARAYASQQAGYRCANAFRWLSEFDSETPPYLPIPKLYNDRCRGTFYEIMQSAIYQDDDLERRRLVNRALFKFYTAFLERGWVDEVAKNLSEDTRDCDLNYRKRFDVVLNLVAKRDPETLDLHQPLVHQLVRFSPFSRQGPELPKPVAREVLKRLPEDIIGGASQRRAALRVWISDEERRLTAASIPFPSAYEIACIMDGIPGRAFPQALAKAFGGRGRARHTALLIQNLAPECANLSAFNKLCDQWNHVPAAKDVVLALQATALKEVKRCGLIFFDRSLETVQQTINRIPAEAARQQVRDFVASALIKESTLSVQTDSICRTFNHQRTLEDVRECTHGLIARRAQEAKGAVRNLAEGYRHSLGL